MKIKPIADFLPHREINISEKQNENNIYYSISMKMAHCNNQRNQAYSFT